MIENGDTQYAWQELDEHGWGIIHAFIPMVGVSGQLMHRDLAIVRDAFGPLAYAHVAASGNPLRLAKFELAEVLRA